MLSAGQRQFPWPVSEPARRGISLRASSTRAPSSGGSASEATSAGGVVGLTVLSGGLPIPDRCRRRHDLERRSAIVSCSASSSGVGLILNAAVAAVEHAEELHNAGVLPTEVGWSYDDGGLPNLAARLTAGNITVDEVILEVQSRRDAA